MTLPPLPPARLMAFDESIEIKGYNRSDMEEYARTAVLINRPAAWWRRALLHLALHRCPDPDIDSGYPLR